eukprot:2379581-Amphidinium_carterae.2
MPAPMGFYAWKNAWPEVSSPNVMENLTARQLQEISRIMRQKAKDCGKPSLLRMGYDTYPDQRSWEDYSVTTPCPWLPGKRTAFSVSSCLQRTERRPGWPAPLESVWLNWGGPQ